MSSISAARKPRSANCASRWKPRRRRPVEGRVHRHRLARAAHSADQHPEKFTPDGGTIRVRVLHDVHDAIIEVADNGEGMSHDLLQHIFDRFTQGTGSMRKGGLGLGLSIVRHIVELHGGSVSAGQSRNAIPTHRRRS